MMWYDFLPAVSKNALETANFGAAICPFTNGRFASNLAQAAV